MNGLGGLSGLAGQQAQIGNYQQAQMLRAQPDVSRQEQAATEWHMAANALELRRAEAQRAAEALAAAESHERDAWNALESVAGRASPAASPIPTRR